MYDSHYFNDFLESQLKIKIQEKAQYGEVFTPLAIIDEKLASLPPSYWKSPDKRWLDPACGIGNYMIKAILGGQGYPGLFHGLKSKIKDPKRRLQHIVSMFTLYDINESNVNTATTLLKKLAPDSTPHVIHGDFLQIKHTPTDKYDIILGNPPYNLAGTKRKGTKRVHVDFVKSCLPLLNPTGHLLFVCPPNYREHGSTMNKLFQADGGHFVYIHIMGPDETLKVFKIQSRIDIFLYCKSPNPNAKTHIVDLYGHHSHQTLYLDRHIPNFGHSIFEKLRKVKPAQIHAFRNTEATTIHCAKSGLSNKGTHPILHLIVEGGRRVLRRKTPHSLQHRRKIFLNGLGLPYVYYDQKGVYGPSQTPVIILDPPQKLVQFMKTPLFTFMTWALRITGNNNLPYLFDDIPDDYASHLTLTQEEEALVQKFQPYVFEEKDIMIDCKESD